ncbi:UDP-glycosyltransferase UGT5-like isoform X2 [Lycorma delicatula]|uniref:UDP-glycosyltransferase UGT5-like isoform X2 n=1 Tax=Lycorma delicatula TaxID=130591 RepID=UPI003F51A4FA
MNSLTIIGVLLYIKCCSAANILGIFPTPSYSHQKPMLALSHALAKKGHNLTVITANPSQEPMKNHRDIDISYGYKEWQRVQAMNHISLQVRISPSKIIGDMYHYTDFFTSLVFGSPNVQELMRELNGTKIDLILYESLYYSSLLGFKEITGDPPVVGLLSLHPFMLSDLPQGNPMFPSYVPFSFLPSSDKMTFWERLFNLYLTIYSHYITEYYLKPIQENYLRKYFGNVKYTAEALEYNKSLLIISADFATSYPRPMQPNTVYVGPMHIIKPKPLPVNLQKWMDEAEDGIIYFSLGSNMKGTSVPEEKRAAFIEAFKKFPKTRVLWKWEADIELPGKPENVLLRKWFPQQSILAHPKLRLFISQVGVQSFEEATFYGIPVLAIPMFADQDFHARKIVESGAGLKLEFDDITFENVYDRLKALLTNPNYKENMMRLSSITKDKPMSPVDTAVWWVEYVLRHKGASHLRPAVLDLPWYQYFMIDIFIFILTILFVIIYLLNFIYTKTIKTNINSKYYKHKKDE